MVHPKSCRLFHPHLISVSQTSKLYVINLVIRGRLECLLILWQNDKYPKSLPETDNDLLYRHEPRQWPMQGNQSLWTRARWGQRQFETDRRQGTHENENLPDEWNWYWFTGLDARKKLETELYKERNDNPPVDARIWINKESIWQQQMMQKWKRIFTRYVDSHKRRNRISVSEHIWKWFENAGWYYSPDACAMFMPDNEPRIPTNRYETMQ